MAEKRWVTSDPNARFVVADNNEVIVVTFYGDGQAMATEIKPLRALQLARQLVDAALRNLEGE